MSNQTQPNYLSDEEQRSAWRDRDTIDVRDERPADETDAREDETGTYARVENTRTPTSDERPELSATPYLSDQTSSQAGERWQRIQGEFVDDPRKSVNEAHELVSELMQRVVDTFAKERNDLEQQWSGGGDVSTENLRVCMQRYRAFFSRLLPINEQQAQRAREAG
ncbi:MAG: hypothetical protein RL701_6802 [Pseudomonadota bacterium]|jgi:hypothetical protein